MQKQRYIQFKSFLLLLVYLISNSPSVLFHHHSAEVISHEKQFDCKEHIQHSKFCKEVKCHHSTRIAKPHKKCGLCDNHTVSPHAIEAFLLTQINYEFYSGYIKIPSTYFYQIPSVFSNRGPPSVSS